MSVSRSLIYSLGSTAIGFVAMLISSMIVSRLLTPAEMGVFTVSMGVIGLLVTLRVFGVSAYLIQARELDDDRIRMVLGLSILVCWGLGLIVILLRGPASTFYGQPQIETIFLVLAVEFLVYPFRIIPMSLLERRMAFGKSFLVEAISSVIGSAVTVTLVTFDMGVLSLAVGRVTTAVMALIMIFIAVPGETYIRPRFAISREVLGFSSTVVLTNLVASLRSVIAPLYLGKAIGVAGAAQYEKGEAPVQIIWNIIMPSVSRVLLPHFASGARAGGQEVDRFLVSVNLATAVFWPAFAAIGIMAPSLIELLYGSQWLPAGPVGTAMAGAAMFSCATALVGPLFLASGKPLYNLIVFGADAVARLAALILAAPYGLIWIGVALIVPAALSSALALVLLRRHLGGRLGPYLAALARPALVTMVTVLGPLAVVAWLGYRTPDFILASFAGGAATALMWLVGVALFHRGLLRALAEAYTNWRAAPAEPPETPAQV